MVSDQTRVNQTWAHRWPTDKVLNSNQLCLNITDLAVSVPLDTISKSSKWETLTDIIKEDELLILQHREYSHHHYHWEMRTEKRFYKLWYKKQTLFTREIGSEKNFPCLEGKLCRRRFFLIEKYEQEWTQPALKVHVSRKSQR